MMESLEQRSLFSVINVPINGNIQNAINGANSGDTIRLANNTTYHQLIDFGSKNNITLDSATLPSDFNNDGTIDSKDFTIFGIAFNNQLNKNCDLNGDNKVDTIDFCLFSVDFGKIIGIKAIINGDGAETIIKGGTNITIKNIEITNANGLLQAAHAAVKGNSGFKFDNSIITGVTATGLALSGSDHVISNSTFTFCGQSAYVLEFTNNTKFTNCKFLNNNNGVSNPKWTTQTVTGFNAPLQYQENGLWFVNADFESVGKVWSSTNYIFENCESAYNRGPGFWDDYKNSGGLYKNCFSHDNRGRNSSTYYQGEGFRLELSNIENAQVIDCIAKNNTGAGITFMTVSNVIVTNFYSENNFTGALFRDDDTRGDNGPITISLKVIGSSVTTRWGTGPYGTRIVTILN